jgi:hypothetical protein
MSSLRRHFDRVVKRIPTNRCKQASGSYYKGAEILVIVLPESFASECSCHQGLDNHKDRSYKSRLPPPHQNLFLSYTGIGASASGRGTAFPLPSFTEVLISLVAMASAILTSALTFRPQGANIQNFIIENDNIILRLPTPEDYGKRNTPHFGESIGRVANRLPNPVVHLNESAGQERWT